jgi:hypothetical protein
MAGAGIEPALSMPAATGLEASRRRRFEAQALRRRRLATRTVPAMALVLGSATMLPIAVFRDAGGRQGAGPLQADPPSLTFKLDRLRFEVPGTAVVGDSSRDVAQQVTWNPVTDSVSEPTAPTLRQRAHDPEGHLRRRRVSSRAPERAAGGCRRHQLSRRGPMEQHRSHQNGLDVDVYYPRLDRRLTAPISTGQVDRHLTQHLLDRFVAAGAKIVFVGYATGLRGPSGIVVPYPNHEDHMHVRFPAPAG